MGIKIMSAEEKRTAEQTIVAFGHLLAEDDHEEVGALLILIRGEVERAGHSKKVIEWFTALIEAVPEDREGMMISAMRNLRKAIDQGYVEEED